jgi:hypothetical protein
MECLPTNHNQEMVDLKIIMME